MKYVFVFAVFLVLLGLCSAASFNRMSESLRDKLHMLKNAKRGYLLERKFQGLERRDDDDDYDEYDDDDDDDDELDDGDFSGWDREYDFGEYSDDWKCNNLEEAMYYLDGDEFLRLVGKCIGGPQTRNTSVVRSLLATMKKLTKK